MFPSLSISKTCSPSLIRALVGPCVRSAWVAPGRRAGVLVAGAGARFSMLLMDALLCGERIPRYRVDGYAEFEYGLAARQIDPQLPHLKLIPGWSRIANPDADDRNAHRRSSIRRRASNSWMDVVSTGVMWRYNTDRLCPSAG